ncbi:SDR family oxidoreductase [Pontibacter sp. G13]|uniref:SDR family oxidoreductase n=1 Tax=Pontibacter sp. G13 TaxID=3074898 RepID=UPI00288BF282|nr:SDR family oxidoreductase [Pontibacter sp. G13]WNJ17688.1 SDR family oxidoreductase [Pontibacter sp. G13]
MNILITGATGHLGRRVVHRLSSEPINLRLMVRNPAKLGDPPGMEVVQGDYADPSSLQSAFQGIDRAFIVSLHERPMDRAKLHRNAFQAAARAGVKQIVYTSFQGAAADATFNMGRDHAQSEVYLQETGLTYVALRNNFYQSTAHHVVSSNGKILNSEGDGRVAWVSRDDIADLAAHFLMNEVPESRILDVTGPSAISFSELAAIYCELTGLDIQYQPEDRETGMERRATEAPKYRLKDWDLEAWNSSEMAMGRGEAAEVSSTVAEYLGRRPISLREYYRFNPEILEQLAEFVQQRGRGSQ